jgi:hypothetical protein
LTVCLGSPAQLTAPDVAPAFLDIDSIVPALVVTAKTSLETSNTGRAPLDHGIYGCRI